MFERNNSVDPPFFIKESLIFGWEAFKMHYRVFVPIVFLHVAISFAGEFIANRDIGTLMYVARVVGTVAQIIVGMGLINIALRITAGETAAFDDVFSVTHLFFSYIGAAVLYLLMVLGGFLLLIVPGIVWLVLYWLFQYVLIDQQAGALAALSEAKRISKGAWWPLFQFIVVASILNIAGAFTFLIGLFITIPITALATAHVYRTLQKRLEPELVSQEEKAYPKKAVSSLPADAPKASPVHPEHNT